jgi:nitroreductase
MKRSSLWEIRIRRLIRKKKKERAMDFFEVVKRRSSYRGPFLDKPVPDDHIRKIIEAGLLAPSGANYQTTDFVIVRDQPKIEKIADLIGKPDLKTAPLLICLVCDTQQFLERYGLCLSFYVEDASAACENMLLALTALGYASCWLDGVLRREGVAETLGTYLNVPAGRVVRIVLPVGIPARQVTAKPKKDYSERVFEESYPVQSTYA